MPSYLVFGCTNFNGRALVQRLCAERAQAADGGASWEIRGVDKVLPELASFPNEVLGLFGAFDYRMGNLRSPEFLEAAFEGRRWDYVFNFAAEHKFGQSTHVYEQDVHQLSVAIARLAQRYCDVLVHLSSAHIYKPGKHRHDEGSPQEATHELAAAHIGAERDIADISGLRSVVLRPALCYGPGDRQNVVPMLIAAQLSQHTGEAMPVLWDKDLRVSTVHVSDVARAALAAAHWFRAATEASSVVFNLADPGDTTNQKLARVVGQLFGVKPTFQNSAVNLIARRLKVEELTEEVNESLLGPWMDLLISHNVANSPLSPYLDREHPYCQLERYPLAVDGSRIEKTPGLEFSYQHPHIDADSLRPMLDEFKQQGMWPCV
ncbi:hypothetical protein GGF46_005285 [Coemansia sp. RSA 552]|nr:hypothetical protein GGF46_005285 [Coemansia sp. RSA 552]